MIELIILVSAVLFGPEILKFLTPEKPVKQSDPEITDPCENIVYRPLSPEFNQGSSLLPKGYCYKGDMNYWDDKPHTTGDPYAQKQAEKFIATQKKDAEVANMKNIVLILTNDTAVEIDTTVTDAADETVVFPPPIPPAVPVATAATGVDDGAFTANWNASSGTTEYFLDVATDSGFLSMVTGYDNRSVGLVLTLAISGLTNNTFYYRVRAKRSGLTSASSNTITLSTVLMDIDGNSYSQVTIGNQIWLQQNLKVTKYADGSAIPNLIINDYNDWYLPSLDELQAMSDILHLSGLGGFADEQYWSSTEVTAATAYCVYMGTPGEAYHKLNTFHVRACRSFTGTAEDYPLRSIGPAGGYIFAHDNGLVYEAEPTDLSVSQDWSNIINVEIGTTGTVIGTGKQNTADIIAQSGHTASAAKLCNDLSIGGWINDTIGAMCYYDNDPSTYKATYGALYNWFAVNNAAGFAYLERNGIQVTGYRVATQTDVIALSTYLGGDTVSGGKLKEAGTVHWLTPNTGADNSSGFTALPNGARHLLGSFVNNTKNSYLWGSSAGLPGNGFYYTANYNDDNLTTGGSDDNNGYAVRLVKDV